MADPLASLEISIIRAVGAAQRLRTSVTRIDEYMNTQRHQDFTTADSNTNNRINPNNSF